jgi:Flp pilus assembly protein TadD
LEPQKPYLRVHLIDLLLEAGEDAQAEAGLSDALARHPSEAALHFHQSRLLQRRERLEEAVAAARRARELDPGRASFHDRLAALLVEAGRPDEAEASLREAIAGKVESGGMYFRLSQLLQEQRPQEALAAARRAIEVEPQKPYLHERLVTLLLAAGDETEAEAVLRDALTRHPGHAALHFHRSRLWQRRRRPAQALAAARRAAELEPERRRWQNHLAALLAEAGRGETRTVPARAAEGASVLEFPATRSGRGQDRAAGAPFSATAPHEAAAEDSRIDLPRTPRTFPGGA